MRGRRKGTAVLLSALLVAAMAGTVSVPANAEGEDRTLPAVNVDSVDWEGGLLEIPLDLGDYSAENLKAELVTGDGYYDRYDLNISGNVATVSLFSNFMSCDQDQLFSHEGVYDVSVIFYTEDDKQNTDYFTLSVGTDSSVWKVEREKVPFDGSQDITFTFENGTNNYELQSISKFVLYGYFTDGMGPGEDITEGFTYDLDAGTITFDKDILKQAVIDFAGSKENLNRMDLYLNVYGTAKDGTEVMFDRVSPPGYIENSETAWAIDITDLDFDLSGGSQEQTAPSAEFSGVNAPGLAVTTGSSDTIASDALSFVQENYADELAVLGEDYTVSAELVLNEVDAADVADEAKTAFNGILDGKTIGQYYDISVQADVLKDGEIVEGLENIPVTDMKDQISVSLQIPENLLKDGRTYSMLRYHDGQASVLDTTESEGTVTFATDGFSAYALAYADAQEQGTPIADQGSKDTPKTDKTDKVTNNGTGVTVEKTSASADKAPKTGDQTDLFFPFAGVAAGMLLIASVYGLRRKMK